MKTNDTLTVYRLLYSAEEKGEKLFLGACSHLKILRRPRTNVICIHSFRPDVRNAHYNFNVPIRVTSLLHGIFTKIQTQTLNCFCN